MRRDKNDLKWKEVKLKVTKRDKNKCRFIKTCSIKESMKLEIVAPKPLVTRLDHAHVFPVSLYPHMCYEERNIVLLNRYVHHNLDDCKHPITGESISRDERNTYWERIVGKETYAFLKKMAVGDNHGEEEE